MTTPTPRPPKARPKPLPPRVWKAWAVANTSIAGHLFMTGGPLAVYRTRGSAPAFMLLGHGLSVVRVLITEIRPTARRAGR